MISRHWKGIAKHGKADHYIEHLETDTFPKIRKINGFFDASILKRPIKQGTEFLIITVWESMEAIQAFAGEDAETAVVPPVVRDMMVSYDSKVTHYEIATYDKTG